jgi:hypothetical protein
MSALSRPSGEEYAEYYRRYVDLVPDADILSTLKDQLGETLALLESVPEDRESFRYAEGKWSLREVVGHLLDTERLFAYRALAMSREDGVDLPGMDQDVWVASSRADHRPLKELGAEWAALRRSNVYLFSAMTEEQGSRSGIASGNPFTVRSFPWIIAGHELWHRDLIERLYLPKGA